MLDQLFIQSQIRVESAVKSRWFYDGDGCPGCGREVKAMKFMGQDALSLNAFIFREHGVLIGYLLCGKCARYVLKESEKSSNSKTDLHAKVDGDARQAYAASRVLTGEAEHTHLPGCRGWANSNGFH